MCREEFRSVENISLTVDADSFASRRSFGEDDGEGHSCRVLQLSYVPVRSQEKLSVHRRNWKTVRMVLPWNEFWIAAFVFSWNRFTFFFAFFFFLEQSLSYNLVEVLYWWRRQAYFYMKTIESLGIAVSRRLHRLRRWATWTRLQLVRVAGLVVWSCWSTSLFLNPF